jgi:hypothetical protein
MSDMAEFRKLLATDGNNPDFILPDDPSVPEPFRGKSLRIVVTDAASLAKPSEPEKLAEPAPAAAKPTPPPLPAEPSVNPIQDAMLESFVSNQVTSAIGDDPVLKAHRDEILETLSRLKPESRVNSEVQGAAIAMIAGRYRNEYRSLHTPELPVTEAQPAAATPDDVIGKLSPEQKANISHLSKETVTRILGGSRG